MATVGISVTVTASSAKTTTAKTTTKATTKATDPKTRSLELAAEKGETSCSHAAKTLGWTLDEQGALVSLALEIRSAHSDEQVYAVGYSASDDDASCDCTAANYGHPCWHRGLGILAGRVIARCYTPAARAEQLLEERTAERLQPSGRESVTHYATRRVREEW